MTVHLPVFQGYTVDVRLKEFRKADPDQGLEFVSFESPKGEKLLERFIATLDIRNKKDRETLFEIWE